MKRYELNENERTMIMNLRAICCVLIVFTHAGSSLVEFEIKNDFFESIKYLISYGLGWLPVPLFFVTSSVLLYRKEFLFFDNLKKKMKTLLIPYFLMQLLWTIIDLLIQTNESNMVFFQESSIIKNWGIGDFLQAYGITASYPLCSQLWFLRDLFFLNIFALVIKKIIDKFPKTVIITILLLWLVLPSYPTIIPFINLQGIVFWPLGYYIVKYDLHFNIKRKSTKIILISIFAFLLVYNSFFDTAKQFERLSILFGIINILMFLQFIQKYSFSKMITKFSKYNLIIYEFHEPNLTACRMLCKKFLPNSIFYQIIEYFSLPILIIICCVILYKLLEKIVPNLLRLLTGDR